MLEHENLFEKLVGDVQSCRRCDMMAGCTRVLSWANGPPNASVMFVGEAPGRLGADRTAVPFHGDKAGDNFEALLGLAGLARRDVFVTNAVLCNPRNEAGNNTAPPKAVLKNCSENLREQIEAVRPKIVVTLGAIALEGTRLVESHSLALSSDVRTANRWFGRTLIPLYHPGARAMIHRNFAAQTADYYFLGEQVKRLAKSRRTSRGVRGSIHAWNTVKYILSTFGECSLFRLHKTMYLLDLESIRRRERMLTDFLYIRQKDGPYCVELGSRWYKNFEDQLTFKMKNGRPWLTWNDRGLFSDPIKMAPDDLDLVNEIASNIRSITDSQLKTRSYLTEPMRISLDAERNGLRQLNKPLL